MWPWEHLAVGYLGYAALRRAGGARGPPGGGPVLALGVATQLPDLVDKPLAWSLGVLPSGTSLAHSVLVAVPGAVVAVLVARRAGAPAYGAAVAVGWLSHLVGDVVYPVLLGGSPAVAAVLWPVVPAPPGAGGGGVLAQARRLFALFLAFLATPRGWRYLVGEAALLGLAGLVWLAEGAPGVDTVRGVVRRAGNAFGGLACRRSRR